VGNIENEDGTGCGVEQKIVHPRGKVFVTEKIKIKGERKK
jgi:hypothetical protein